MRRWVVFALMLVLLPLGFATFPYGVDWLPYADTRLIYQIDVTGLSNQDVYAIIDVDANFIQDYINRWSSICDPSNKYDWFWPTFTYASTYNNTQRMLEVVSRDNWQTFTVGSCGTIDLPTRFVVKLPNGVLDGDQYFTAYEHYIYVYYKKPFSDDFYDNTLGVDEYAGSAQLKFSSQFPKGYYFYGIGCSINFLERNVSLYIDLDDGIPSVICSYSSGYDPPRMAVRVLGNYYEVLVGGGQKCANIEEALRNAGLSGTVLIEAVDLSTRAEGYCDAHTSFWWWWFIPDSIIKDALWSGN